MLNGFSFKFFLGISSVMVLCFGYFSYGNWTIADTPTSRLPARRLDISQTSQLTD